MTTISNVKEHIAGILPEKILKAFTAYDDFSRIPPSEGVKEFAGYHNACKNALAHLVALLRLSEIIQDHSEDTSAQEWLSKAQMSLQQDAEYEL